MMNIHIGEKIKFAMPMDNHTYKILIGTLKDIVMDDKPTYAIVNICIDHFKNKYINTDISIDDIIEIVDIHKTNHPIELINDFRYSGSKYEECLKDVFTNGLCYIFAQWLKDRLCNAKIVYLKEEHHYVVDYYDHLYDITGEVTEQYKHCTKCEHKYEGDWAKDR